MTAEDRIWGEPQPGKPESEVQRERGQLTLPPRDSAYDRWLTEEETKEKA